MRSNIASTCGSARVPRPAAFTTRELLQRRQEVDELVELLGVLLLHRRERRHRRRGVHERARDRLAAEPSPDFGERRPRSAVAVLADLVAREAARGRSDVLALLVLLGH